MPHIDTNKVKGKIAECGYTVTSFAERLGISRNTLASYLKRPDIVPYNVVSNMASILCDDEDEAVRIFFAP